LELTLRNAIIVAYNLRLKSAQGKNVID